ncbi:hypothetical protein MPLSOD_50115 [Mesorhizobium sp. SOD10]|nr:hypothetical protein MPLSOD_50115 [Mesorhizobium sp. SOD10]
MLISAGKDSDEAEADEREPRCEALSQAQRQAT